MVDFQEHSSLPRNRTTVCYRRNNSTGHVITKTTLHFLQATIKCVMCISYYYMVDLCVHVYLESGQPCVIDEIIAHGMSLPK